MHTASKLVLAILLQSSIVLGQSWLQQRTPLANALNVSKATTISAKFSVDVNPTTLNNSTVKVRGSISGLHQAALLYTPGTRTLLVTPSFEFFAGEVVYVTLTTGIQNTLGDPMPRAESWRFSAIIGGSGWFKERSHPAVGSAPYGVVAADLDGDGDADLAVANANSNNVTILRNDGQGNYVSSHTLNVGTSPISIVAEDLDGDGDIDLAAVNNLSNTVSILKNNGSGGFTQTSTPGTGSYPYGIAAGDFDGDGDIDLAVTNQYPNTVSILLNNGDGTFVQASTPSTGINPGAIAPGDFDGDGDIDLAVCNSADNTISILLNGGTASFATSGVISVGKTPSSIVANDFDSDRDLDLVVTLYTDDKMAFVKNNGSGVFTTSNPLSVDAGPYSLTSADLDGDGDIDVAIAFLNSDSVATFKNNGNGQFSIGPSAHVGNSPYGIVNADVDGDNDADLITANSGSGTVSVVKNRNTTPDIGISSTAIGYGTIRSNLPVSKSFQILNEGGVAVLQVSSIVSSNPAFAISPGSGIINPRDSLAITATFTPTKVRPYADSLIVSSNDPVKPTVKLYLSGTGGPTVTGFLPAKNSFTSAPTTPVSVIFNGAIAPQSVNASSLCLFGSVSGRHRGAISCDAGLQTVTLVPDANFVFGEQVQTVVTDSVRSSPLSIPVMRGYSHQFKAAAPYGTGTYTLDSLFSTGTNPYALEVADINGDGYPDIVVANSGSNNVGVYLNNKMGRFSPPVTYPVGSSTQGVAVGDIDSDGDMDIIATNSGSNNISVLRNNGAGILGAATTYLVGVSPRAIAVRDLDNDGDLDIVVGNISSNTISILRNNGTGIFSPSVDIPVGSSPSGIAIDDFDGDGLMDIAVTNRGSNTLMILWNTNGTFSTSVTYTAGTQPNGLVAADLDNDGYVDMAATSGQNARVVLFFNDGLGGFGTTSQLNTGNGPTGIYSHDFDGDGDMDLATANVGGNSISILKNNGNRTFANAVSLSTGTQPRAVVGVDIRGLGVLDLVAVNYQTNGMRILRNGTTLSAPSAPSLLLPSDGALGQPVNITLTWTAPTNAVKYWLQVSTDSLFASFVLDNHEITDTSYLAGPLAANTRYYWRVRAQNVGGLSPFSTSRYFITLGPPAAAPSLLSPSDRATGLPIQPSLSWNAVNGATRYHVQIATDSLFVSVIAADSLVTGLSYDSPVLQYYSTYFWRVRGGNIAGYGGFATARRFTTTFTGPTLVSPPNGALNVATTLPLIWDPVAGGTAYRLQVATDSSFQNVFLDNSLITGTSYQLGPLTGTTRFYWRVRAFSAEATGDWSAIWTFRTGNSTGVSPEAEIPVRFSLEQNYPNPFNPSTTVRYGVPHEGHVKLEIFNMLGERVALLVDARQTAGFHSVRFGSDALPSGVYYCRMIASDFSEVRALMLLR